MQIYKFGGTSVGTAANIKAVKNIINNDEKKIIVLSANGKTTDHYVSLANSLSGKNYKIAVTEKSKLMNYYFELIDELFASQDTILSARQYIHSTFHSIQSKFEKEFTQLDEKWLLSRGEIISTRLFSMYLEENLITNTVIPAPAIIRKENDEQVSVKQLQINLSLILESKKDTNLFITQGFICTDQYDNIDNLGRGGSDYTASLLGQAIQATAIQIWSDVDGFHNNDPGYVKSSTPLLNLSFDEAAELAYFGARILHPQSIIPAHKARIPVLLKNTFNPDATGTLISDKIQAGGIKAVAAKDGITAITIHSGRMLMAFGFLKKIFEVFENYKTPVDMVTTSEVSVSVTIDNTFQLENIIKDLNFLGELDFTNDQSIVCIVGDQLTENQGNVARIFSAVGDIPIRMISYGAAKNSISILVDTKNKTQTLEALNSLLPENKVRRYQYV